MEIEWHHGKQLSPQVEKVIATTVTKEDWLYTSDKLPVGEYIVQVSTVPEGLAGTFEVGNVQDGSVKVELGADQDCARKITTVALATMGTTSR